MMIIAPAREAPAPPPLERLDLVQTDPARPPVPDEPLLAMDNIQGNSIAGFNKDFQTLLLLKILDVPDFKRWLKSLVPFIATAAEVLAFNRLFKAIRNRRGPSHTVEATWINIAFSYHALTLLADDATDFTDEAFKQGLAARSASLGDPTDPEAEGNPENWVIGGPGNEADVILIVESDDQDDLFAEVARIEHSLFPFRSATGRIIRSGAVVVFKQQGATLPQPLTGHEHFGFLDGVSQPGLRGRISDNPTDVLTFRQNPNNREQGKPGQDLLWPGEFVFGYPGQDPNSDEITEPGPIAEAGPAWAKDGSFLVFRRLRQDVQAFREFVNQAAFDLGLSPQFVGAKLVGRWASGAPILRAPEADNRLLADDDCANNNFEFGEETEQILPEQKQSPIDCDDVIPSSEPPALFPPSEGDPDGQVCPFAAHIRKAYPRDDTSSTLPSTGEVSTQTHRIIRRGIPFGEPFRDFLAIPFLDFGERGLLFLAYQTSIVEQFEFILKNWVNNPDFKEPQAGHDLIIGQNNTPGADRERNFTISFKRNGVVQREVISTRADWVIPTGGGYFFAPSIAALELLSS
ncbi:MAG TPA: Dyp-type peroxidase [Roseiflexaceae bacterium]|nr:Dyp-type peroxidase [Roseiflexaceae bacterium]